MVRVSGPRRESELHTQQADSRRRCAEFTDMLPSVLPHMTGADDLNKLKNMMVRSLFPALSSGSPHV